MIFRNYINDNYKSFCTGCSACVQKCPKGALSIIEDDQGYYVAHFDKDACVDCGLCDNICPAINDIHPIERSSSPSLYAVQMPDEIRQVSSSGGVFSGLASIILSEGGVVFGASWSDDFSVRHISVESESDLYKLRSSKYVQSYLGDSYKRVKNLLKEGRKVLFSGTPCQIAGLNVFLGKDDPNLLTIDVLCLCAPSYKYLQSYMTETFTEKKAESCDMRDKQNGWKCTNLSVMLEDGTKVIKKENDIWEQAFLSRLMMSDHCNNCKYSRHLRNGDISIGDFWEICKLDSSFDDKGTNSMLVNSAKGAFYAARLLQNAAKYTQRTLSELDGNRISKRPWAVPHKHAQRFQQLYPHLGFTQSAQTTLQEYHDVAILGCWEVRNYGSHLTYYALYRVLKSLGKEVVFIGCPQNAPYKTKGLPEYFKEIPYEKWEMAPQFRSKVDMRLANSLADTFIVGSDQLWSPVLYKHFGSFAFLDFIHDNKRKIAYATSFGASSWNGTERERYEFSYYLSRFSDISVRESSGVDICQQTFGVNAEWRLDPVFLCDIEDYDTLISKSKIETDGDYIAAYILDCDIQKQHQLVELSKQLNCALRILVDPNIPHELDPSIPIETGFTVEDWLKWIRNGKYVITDSFHGMCVSIIFKKRFVAIKNVRRGSARFEDYGSLLHIEERILNSFSETQLICQSIRSCDYSYIDEFLISEKQKSVNWLRTAITKPILSKSLSDFDILSIRSENTTTSHLESGFCVHIPNKVLKFAKTLYRKCKFSIK